MEDCYHRAILKHGRVSASYHDNGKQFVSKQLIQSLSMLGTRVLKAKPYSSQSKGGMKVFNRFVNAFLAEVSARGSYFHPLFGHHAYDSYVCIPNWDVGTELALLSDTFWNFEKLSSTQLKKVDACSVVYALLELSNHVKV